MLGFFRLSLCFLLLPLLAACTPATEHQVLELQGATMGTTYSIQVVDAPKRVEPSSLRRKIAAHIGYAEQA